MSRTNANGLRQWKETSRCQRTRRARPGQGYEEEGSHMDLVPGLKGMSRQREYMSMPEGLSLDMAPWETLPGFSPLHLQPFWSLPLHTPIPLLGPGLLGAWNSVLFTVTLSPLHPPQCLAQCLTLRRYKIKCSTNEEVEEEKEKVYPGTSDDWS